MARGEADSLSNELDRVSNPSSGALTRQTAYGSRGSAEGNEPGGPLSHMPPLSLLAALSALTHVVAYRLLLPLIALKKQELPTALLLLSPFTLNLAVCAALVAFGSSSVELVRAREVAHASRRILIAGLSALLASMLLLATFAPEGQLSAQQVLFATGALHTLVVQLALMALHMQRSLAGRTTVALIAAASVFPLASLLLRQLDPLTHAALVREGVASLYGLGELAYLLVPIAAAFVIVPWADDRRARSSRRAGAVGVGMMALVFAAAARMPDAAYGHVLYSTLRLEWALEKASLGYAVPVSLAAGAALSATVSADTRHRQGGAGLLLWLAAGFNPLTPARLLMAALGASLLCRAIISVAQDAHPPKS